MKLSLAELRRRNAALRVAAVQLGVTVDERKAASLIATGRAPLAVAGELALVQRIELRPEPPLTCWMLNQLGEVLHGDQPFPLACNLETIADQLGEVTFPSADGMLTIELFSTQNAPWYSPEDLAAYVARRAIIFAVLAQQPSSSQA